jgi:hypothetical protein
VLSEAEVVSRRKAEKKLCVFAFFAPLRQKLTMTTIRQNLFGMSLMFILFGGLGAVAGLAGYFIPAIREAEERMPDHEAVTAVALAVTATAVSD